MTVLLYIISTLDSSLEIINDNVTRKCEPLPAGFPLGAAVGVSYCWCYSSVVLVVGSGQEYCSCMCFIKPEVLNGPFKGMTSLTITPAIAPPTAAPTGNPAGSGSHLLARIVVYDLYIEESSVDMMYSRTVTLT